MQTVKQKRTNWLMWDGNFANIRTNSFSWKTEKIKHIFCMFLQDHNLQLLCERENQTIIWNPEATCSHFGSPQTTTAWRAARKLSVRPETLGTSDLLFLLLLFLHLLLLFILRLSLQPPSRSAAVESVFWDAPVRESDSDYYWNLRLQTINQFNNFTMRN